MGVNFGFLHYGVNVDLKFVENKVLENNICTLGDKEKEDVLYYTIFIFTKLYKSDQMAGMCSTHLVLQFQSEKPKERNHLRHSWESSIKIVLETTECDILKRTQLLHRGVHW
jgi:hypothetical protein